MLQNQALAIETFQSKWQMAGQEAHAFIARTRSQSEDFVRAELTAVQRVETSLQRQHDGQLKLMSMHFKTSVANTLDRRRIRCARSSSMPPLKNPVCVTMNCNKPYDTMCPRRSMQMQQPIKRRRRSQLISQQAETMKRFESQSQQYVTQQHDEWTQKQHAQFQKFDGVIKDKDEVFQSLRQELANNQERHLQELDQALQDAQRRAQQAMAVFKALLLSLMRRPWTKRHM